MVLDLGTVVVSATLKGLVDSDPMPTLTVDVMPDDMC